MHYTHPDFINIRRLAITYTIAPLLMLGFFAILGAVTSPSGSLQASETACATAQAANQVCK